MITLNDYLYSGDTLLRILQKYIEDLRKEARKTHNEIDLVHCNFLLQIRELLEHNDFLTAQSQQIREFYKYMRGNIRFLPSHLKGVSSPLSGQKKNLTAILSNSFMTIIRSMELIRRSRS